MQVVDAVTQLTTSNAAVAAAAAAGNANVAVDKRHSLPVRTSSSTSSPACRKGAFC